MSAMLTILKASEYICVLSVALCAFNAGFLLLLHSLSRRGARQGLAGIARAIGTASLWCGLAVSLCGVGIFGYLAYLWTSSGRWTHLALLELAVRLLPEGAVSWLRNPRSLHELSHLVFGLLRHTPLFVLIIVLGGIMMYTERFYDRLLGDD